MTTMRPEAPAPVEGCGQSFAGRVARVERIFTRRGDPFSCLVCSRVFTCEHNRQVTCSPECHKARTKETRTGYRRSLKGRKTTRTWRQVARNRPKYRAAVKRYRLRLKVRRPPPPFRIERNCRQCGEGFLITDPERASALSCSRRCRKAWRLAYWKARRAAPKDAALHEGECVTERAER